MITIGIPFYNDERFLEYAIKSVFNQTYTDWKLILISDGGTDRSLEIAKKYEKDPRVTLVYDGQNRKLPYRLNQLSNMVQTEFYARMDADDIMHPMRIETQLKILQENPNIDILGTNAYSIDEHNNIQGIRLDINDENYELKTCTGFIHPSIMGKTKWFKENPYDEKAIRIEDYELWQRTLKKSSFKVWTEPLLLYREFGGEYYKKYFNGKKSMFYVAKKTNNPKLYYNAVRYYFKGIIYYFFWLVKRESILVNKRLLKATSNNIELAQTILDESIK